MTSVEKILEDVEMFSFLRGRLRTRKVLEGKKAFYSRFSFLRGRLRTFEYYEYGVSFNF